MARDSTALRLEDDVLPMEREELAKRRNSAGFELPSGAGPKPGGGSSQNGASYTGANVVDPVGLALSGGGIRSAAFSLGILQAFYERGLLRYCDYLSTVSGGSYAGGFLTSLAVHKHTNLDWRDGNIPGSAKWPETWRRQP